MVKFSLLLVMLLIFGVEKGKTEQNKFKMQKKAIRIISGLRIRVRQSCKPYRQQLQIKIFPSFYIIIVSINFDKSNLYLHTKHSIKIKIKKKRF